MTLRWDVFVVLGNVGNNIVRIVASRDLSRASLSLPSSKLGS